MSKKFKKSKIGIICLNIIRFSSYLILFTPLIFSGWFFFPFVGPKSLYFMGLSQIIFFSWLILIFIEPKYRPKFNLLLLGLILYLFVFVLASIFGVNFSYSFWSKFERMTGILMKVHLFAFFLVLSSVFDEEDFKKFFGFSIFVAILSSLIALVNLANPMMRGGGLIGNESFLGTYLLFNCFFAFYLVFKTSGFSRTLSLISFFFLVFALLSIGVHFKNLSFSDTPFAIFFKQGARAAKLSFYGGLILLFYFWLISFQKRGLKILGALLLIFSVIFGSYATFSAISQPQGFFKKLVEKEVGSFGGRFPIWQGAIKAFLERPLLGWGPENFEYSFTKYYNPCLFLPECGGEIWFDRAHNIIFDTLISSGILGLISYFLIFVFSFFILWKNFLKKKTDFLPAGVFTSLFLAYFIQNLTVFDMVSSYLMFFLSLAFIASFEKEKVFATETLSPRPLVQGLIFTFFLITFVYFVIFPLITGMSVVSAIRQPAFSKERISLYKKSLSLSPLGKFQIRQFFAENTLENFQAAKTFDENMRKEIEFVIQELQKSIKEAPLDFRSHLRLGQILTFYSLVDKTKIPEAERILRKAIELSSQNQQGYWALSQNLIFQGKFDEAISVVQKPINLEPRLKDSHSILIQVAKIVGKLDFAKAKLKEAIEINPQWEESLKKILENS